MNFRGKNSGPGKHQKGKQKGKHRFPSKPKIKDIIADEIKEIEEKLQEFESSNVTDFADFPLSKKTLQGLKACNYKSPTDIQRESIGLALQGNDILGAAKTGSGKTLAFIIPILECLFKEKWSQFDGLGVLIISPTRELAFQTFGVLKKVGRFHDFSAGLVIGGKNLKEEAGRINQTNIVVCTPGRLLQHMDETSYFRADSLKVLVLDEADRILDMGFAQTMNAIIENLPTERQTMLFSATQTRSVKDLARLSLQNPMFVSVHENASESTPSQLEQNYIVCELHDKLNLLWSFLRNHLKSKILVFLTSCKQVKYVYEAFRRLRPGMTVLALHGGMSQLKRVAVYNQYKFKQNVCLFATDIAARGLDFPAVNWVLQLDCPEDSNTYIHRAGRTARYEKDGESLLVLLPTEEEHMVQQLRERKIPIEKIDVNQTKLYKIQHKLEANCAADPTLKEFAQRAFVSYLRSIFLMKNKKVFDVHALDVEAYARSLGLGIAPKVRFMKRDQQRLEALEATKSQKKADAKSDKTAGTSAILSKLNRGDQSDSENDDDEEEEEVEDEEDESEGDIGESEGTSHSKLQIKAKHKQSKAAVGVKVSTNSDSDSDDSSDGEDEDISESDSSDEKTNTKAKSNQTHFNFDIAQDDDDDLFKVKKNVDIDSILGHQKDPDEDSAGLSKKKKKILTKEDIAKKLARKKIMVNTKVKFDEMGQPEIDKLKVAQEAVNIEQADDLGGINLELARQRMQEEDKVDKEIFRQRVKQKHREERLKKREENRLKQQQARHCVEGESEDDEELEVRLASDDEGAPREDPLSFIPDPDEVYGPESSGDSSEESDFDEPTPSKRPKLSKKKASSSGSEEDSDGKESLSEGGSDDERETDSGESDTGVMDTELSLMDDEELALRLLSKR